MKEPINIGLDLGSLGWRAAYVADGQVMTIPAGNNGEAALPWLRCELDPSSRLGVCFPGLKNHIGMDTSSRERGEPDPAAWARQRFAALRRQVEHHAGRPPGQLVIAVPALYSTARRAALRDLALATGFANVHLLSDSIAAAIGHSHERAAPTTALVYSMGYAGFEIGLIRAVKGRYRAIAYDGASSPCGAIFDEILIHSCLQALLQVGLWSPDVPLTPDQWRHLQQTAQRLKEKLSDAETPALNFDITTRGRRHVLKRFLHRGSFEQAIATLIDPTLDRAQGVLEEAHLEISDVDTLVLVGGSTSIGLVQRMVAERFGRAPTLSDDTLIVRGAARFAAQFEALSTTPSFLASADAAGEAAIPALPVVNVPLSDQASEEAGERPGAASDDANRTGVHHDAEIVLTLDLSRNAPAASQTAARVVEPSMAVMQADRQRLFQALHRLLAGGDTDRARVFLEELIREAQELLAAASQPSSSIGKSVQRVLQRAYSLLKTNRYQQAIEYSHMAYQYDPENPAVFQQMIDIHCRAAMAHSSIEGYPKSMEWLMCAYSHDRTNSDLHDRIAQRHFSHARQLTNRQQYQEALDALKECLNFDPLHEEAQKLQHDLASHVEEP